MMPLEKRRDEVPLISSFARPGEEVSRLLSNMQRGRRSGFPPPSLLRQQNPRLGKTNVERRKDSGKNSEDKDQYKGENSQVIRNDGRAFTLNTLHERMKRRLAWLHSGIGSEALIGLSRRSLIPLSWPLAQATRKKTDVFSNSHESEDPSQEMNESAAAVADRDDRNGLSNVAIGAGAATAAAATATVARHGALRLVANPRSAFSHFSQAGSHALRKVGGASPSLVSKAPSLTEIVKRAWKLPVPPSLKPLTLAGAVAVGTGVIIAGKLRGEGDSPAVETLPGPAERELQPGEEALSLPFSSTPLETADPLPPPSPI